MKFIKTNEGTLQIFANDKNYTVTKEHMNYEKVKDAIRKDDESILDELINIPESLSKFSSNLLEYFDDKFFYQGKELRNVIVERIFALKKENLPFENMVKFLENIMLNPSEKSKENLLDFLEHKALPITEDGCFYAYKRVRDDWTDIHSGQYSNKVGTTLKMERQQVDGNENNNCSYGFHVGSIEYVRNFHSGGHVLIVKVNPADVVAVPRDCNCQKCRVCCYTVVAEYTEELNQSSVYDENVNPIFVDYLDENENENENDTEYLVDPFYENDEDSNEDFSVFYSI